MSGKGKAEQIMGGPMDDDEEEKTGLIGGPKKTCMLRLFLMCVVGEYGLTEDPLRQLGRNVPYLLGDHIPY
jgi:hypothetical protein